MTGTPLSAPRFFGERLRSRNRLAERNPFGQPTALGRALFQLGVVERLRAAICGGYANGGFRGRGVPCPVARIGTGEKRPFATRAVNGPRHCGDFTLITCAGPAPREGCAAVLARLTGI